MSVGGSLSTYISRKKQEPIITCKVKKENPKRDNYLGNNAQSKRRENSITLSQENRKKRSVLYIFLIILVCAIPTILVYTNQRITINNIDTQPKEALSGEQIILSINATNSVNLGYLEPIIPIYKSIFRLSQEIEISINENTITKTLNIGLNNQSINSFELIERSPGSYIVSVDGFNDAFCVLNESQVVVTKSITTKTTPRIYEPINIILVVENKGLIYSNLSMFYHLNNNLVNQQNVGLNSFEKKQITYQFTGKDQGTYELQFSGLSKKYNMSIDVSTPNENMISDVEYYYGTAETYVDESYEVPPVKDIEGLSMLLHQIELPTYSEDVFDCSECTATVEWLLEGAGFQSKIVRNHGWGETVQGPHTWVQVETVDGLVAVETTALTHGMSSMRPGIIARPDGEFLEYTSRYILYKKWMEDHPPQQYDLDPNLSFEDWCDEYLVEAEKKVGMPSDSGYYSTTNRYESSYELIQGQTIGNIHYYVDLEELDWWKNPQYCSMSPFKYWG